MTVRSPAVLLTALALTLTACGTGGSRTAVPPATAPSSAPTGTVGVVASTDVYGSVASAIGGDRVSVTSIIHSPDADPHEYESTPKDALAVGQAKVLITNGGGYDDFAATLFEASATKPTLIDVSRLSGLQDGEDFNEHVWYSLPTMAKLADQLATDLGMADPDNAAVYRSNADAFKAKLDGLGDKLDTIKTTHSGARVAVTEPVPMYLVEAAGLTNATPEAFSHAIEEGNDPPAAVLNETLALFQGPTAVRALLANAQAENPATRQVEQAATQGGVPIVQVTETLPPGTMDYVSWMGGQIDRLAGAMDRA